ncbi:MAG: hypothetical protein IT459_15555 [Planctomycetes bacterium]|nr:hypothetical protein [Planctomycetota bacterium]
MTAWIAFVEGSIDATVTRRVFDTVGLPLSSVTPCGGAPGLEARMPKLAAAARFQRVFVLRDLDRLDCVPTLLRSMQPNAPSGLVIRVAVRQVEAWLLADRDACARWIGVAAKDIARDVESLADAKDHLVSLAAKSKHRGFKNGFVPQASAASARVGPRYTAEVERFVRTRWDPERAARHSESLSRALRALRSAT